MINTDKYEGHLLINGEFSKQVMTPEQYDATKALMNDAPLLLEEVKRLRQGIIDIADKWERPSILRGFLKELMELIE